MLDELYQSLILDHSKKPRNYGELAAASHQADGHNPLCGDRITIFVELTGDTISNIGFVGSGCAIAKASASLMTETVRGKSRREAGDLFTGFRALVTGESDTLLPAADDEAADDLQFDKLQAFAGVRAFPMRVKCATLAWHTLQAALDKRDVPTCTE